MPRLRLTTGQRGYGPEHQKLRKRLLPYAYGTPCPRCGKTMEVGQQLHLGHSDDRRSYTGMEHAECNLKAAVDMRRNAGNHVCMWILKCRLPGRLCESM